MHLNSKPTLIQTAPATSALAGLCVLFWLVDIFLPLANIGGQLSLIPARLTGEIVAQGFFVPAYLTPITMQFAHADFGHLFLNMVFLIFIGRFVENLLGTGRFVALYVVSGVAGAVLEVALDPGSVIPHVGASGSIAGIFAAHAMIFGRREGGATERTQALKLAAVWIILQLGIGYVFNDGSGGGIAIWAHVGGFLCGLILGLPLARDAIKAR
ncbi:rhomboid family intramembrane serine protease [Pacificimonas sp. WHA3]|uniref:Rhomboid family intramembrane serine protease n=1 Tax=Pacificimonas pallii TaxID=2827236 RepID=A0ABS6SFK3_9SPHN|nr:rhomboid family intramembrane serine protease [Pacificimonas pallii]MBV7256833.1 rhomboid family intramembrane serine protease [Pacificimonas pallii]